MLRASWSRVARARDKLQCGEKRGCRDAIDAEDQMPIVLDDLQLRVATEPHTSLVDRNGTNVSRIGIYSPLELRHIVKLESCVRRSLTSLRTAEAHLQLALRVENYSSNDGPVTST